MNHQRIWPASAHIALQLLGIVGFLSFWYLTTKLFPGSRHVLASPGECVSTIGELIVTSGFWHDVGGTLGRTGTGFILGGIFGIPVGIVVGRIHALAVSLELPIDFARSIPVSALFPAFVLWLGAGSQPQIAAAAFGCMMLFIINVMYGVRNCRPQREAYLRSLGATETQILAKVVIWEIAPSILAASRLSLSMSLVLIVVTEMLTGGGNGLGREIQESRLLYKVPQMWVAIFVVGVIGLTLNRFFAVVERRFVHWSG